MRWLKVCKWTIQLDVGLVEALGVLAAVLLVRLVEVDDVDVALSW